MNNDYITQFKKYADKEKEATKRMEADSVKELVLFDVQRKTTESEVTYEEMDKKIQDILKLIDLKYNHSLQVSSDSKETAGHLGFNSELSEFIELSSLLHDIGRFEQARATGTFYESEIARVARYQRLGIKDHGELGRYVLEREGLIRSIVPNTRLFDDSILTIVGEHAKGNLPGYLGMRVKNIDKHNDIGLEEIFKREEYRKELTALNIQIIQDIDRLDIYHQVIDGLWVPLMSDELISDEVYDMFFNGEYLDIQKLRERGLFNFNVGELVRLSFINQMKLVGVAEVIKRQRLLEEMYRIRNINDRSISMPRLKEAYEYTIEQLNDAIINSEDGIYLPQKRR